MEQQARITVVVGNGFYAEIMNLCRANGMTLSDLVRKAIIAYVQAQWSIALTDDTRKKGYQR